MSSEPSFAPLAAAPGQAVSLSMQRLWLTGQVLPAGGRLVVQHIFRSEEDKALEVIYGFPLPRDAALRSFRIVGEGFEAHSELKETEAATKAYEEGVARGSLSTLVRQYGDGVVNLTIGNIRPKETVTVYLEILCGVELRDDGFRFRFPFTLAPNYHARARALVVAAGEGEMELPGDEFGDMILPRFCEDASQLHQVGFELTLLGQLTIDEIASPSHAVRVRHDGSRSARIALAAEKDVPNRDLVFDVRFNSAEPQVFASRDPSGRRHFAAIVPSTSFGRPTESSRRVVILLDRSSSMRGEPIAQARKAIDACLGALSETDSFGLVAFGSDVSTFQPALVFGTRDLREKAHDFLMREHPCGGTDLTRGLLEAAKLFAGGGGDILILTDGQVCGTEAILADAREAGVRLHCMGIGSASQDRFLTLLARETRGVSRFVTPRERVDVPAVDLFASMGRPVASGLKAEGNIQPQPPSSVFSGSPVLLFGECAGEAGADRIEMSWTGGSLTLPIDVSESDMAQTLWLLQGSRLITDWESRYPSEHAMAPLEKRKQNRVAMRLLELSQTYGLASREMSLVAVVTRPGDRPGELPQTRIVPVGMAQDTLFGAFFGMSFLSDVMSRRPSGAMKQTASGSISPGFLRSEMKSMPETSLIRRLFASRNAAVLPADNIRRPNTPDDILIDIASRLESDGGMPGKNLEARAIATVIALLAFLSQGHTLTSGAFRSHVGRLAAFLETVKSLSSERQKIAAAVIQLTRKGRAPAGEWITLASTPGDHWNAVEQGLFAINADGRLVQDRA